MRNNFYEWCEHYHDILSYHFDKFDIFLLENKEEKPDYETFCRFMYDNTVKTKHPFLNKILAPLW